MLSVVLALAAAGGLAWVVRWYEASRVPRTTECSRIVSAVYAKAGSDAKDADLLSELLLDRNRCLQDPTFIDQTRRLMTNLQLSGDARRLLEQAESNRAFKPDELAAQIAWVDAAESHEAWASGEEARGKELNDRAQASANALREKWPEWSLPYRILGEASTSGASGTAYGEGTDYLQLERESRARKLNGAWVRSLTDWQPVVFTFVIAVIGFLAFAAGLDGFLTAREISGRATTRIANASTGYVELKGTLHTLDGASPVIGPHTKEAAVWYELRTNSGAKRAVTRRERSGQRFVLRDASGDVIVDPDKMTVRTRHSATRFGNSVGQMNGSRLTEELLKVDDQAFALGELSLVTDASGKTSKYLRIGSDGRRLFVSNYSEAELISMERLWYGAGITICVLTILMLAWSYYQRYHVLTAPGLLS